MTGVQTCALPISLAMQSRCCYGISRGDSHGLNVMIVPNRDLSLCSDEFALYNFRLFTIYGHGEFYGILTVRALLIEKPFENVCVPTVLRN